MPTEKAPSARVSPPLGGLGLALAIAVLLGGALAAQTARDNRYAAWETESELLYVQSGAALTRLGLAFDDLLADLYWIRAVQHYGSTKIADEADRTYDLLYPFLDLATTLDPRFKIAYRFGAIFLTEAYPDGPGRPE
ncbi:MAG: hypothetical protein QGG24_03415, partial [Vicinamibacterales bacterium]|nr:hypothetical protein [Vicinamibacterales bacterium]